MPQLYRVGTGAHPTVRGGLGKIKKSAASRAFSTLSLNQ
jgi:hypothetical protein